MFYLHVLEETLAYEVDQILTVEPEEMEALEIQEGEDLCTLVTCTPYGINSHRLLVRGHRVALPEETVETEEQQPPKTDYRFFAAVALGLLLIAVVLLIIILKKRRRRQPGNRNRKRR